MKDTIVARRYAKALFDAAREQNLAEQAHEDLKGIVGALEDNAEFRKLLEHPNLELNDKLTLLGNLFEGKVAEPVLATVYIMVERGRGELIGELLRYYAKIVDEVLGKVSAQVSSPQPLSEESKQQVADTFSTLTGKSIVIENIVDPALLGGIRVRIGDRLYDGSLAGKLSEMKKQLAL